MGTGVIHWHVLILFVLNAQEWHLVVIFCGKKVEFYQWWWTAFHGLWVVHGLDGHDGALPRREGDESTAWKRTRNHEVDQGWEIDLGQGHLY